MNEQAKPWIWALILAMLGGMIYLVSNILMPFTAGLFVAYSLNPAVNKLQQWKLSRTLATVVMILSFFFLIGSLLFFAIPFVKTELIHLAEYLPIYGERLLTTLTPHLQTLSSYTELPDYEQLQKTATGHIGDMFSWGVQVLAKVLSNTLAIANLISLIILTPLITFYLLRDWPFMLEAITILLPRRQMPIIVEQARAINRSLGAYVRGQTAVCLILIGLYSLGLSLVGLKFALTIGFVTGVLAFIPYFGILIGFTAAMGVGLSQFSSWPSLGMTAGVFIVGQAVEAYFLTPRFVGNNIGLHPVWLIFALLTGGSLFGFLGIILALPTAAVLSVLVRFFMALYMQSSLYLGAPTPQK